MSYVRFDTETKTLGTVTLTVHARRSRKIGPGCWLRRWAQIAPPRSVPIVDAGVGVYMRDDLGVES